MKKLTQYSPGAGCGCKISSLDLSIILQNVKTHNPTLNYPNLIVGNESSDDCAAMTVSEFGEHLLLSTIDFFTPIVDDPRTFGMIAAANAISDIYAMGGRPLMALGPLGWPLKDLSKEEAQEVLIGAKIICDEAKIPLAGGHSIDIPVPIFGLSVNGIVHKNHLKRNNTAKPGDYLALTKPLGVGLITTAEKRGVVRESDYLRAIEQMKQLNKIGEVLGELKEVSAMTDVTGFGLMGHLSEMLNGANLAARIDFNKIPLLPNLDFYIEQNCIPGGTRRNLQSFAQNFESMSEREQAIFFDPQTSGGLLVAVQETGLETVDKIFQKFNIPFTPFAQLIARD